MTRRTPPSDDADYIKRYHFLEGLSVYWRGVNIMEHTVTKKLEKRFTPFAYKRTIEDALSRTFHHFQGAGAIVLSYSSNALPHADRIVELPKLGWTGLFLWRHNDGLLVRAMNVPAILAAVDVKHDTLSIGIGGLEAPPVKAVGLVERCSPDGFTQPCRGVGDLPSAAAIDHPRGNVVDHP